MQTQPSSYQPRTSQESPRPGTALWWGIASLLYILTAVLWFVLPLIGRWTVGVLGTSGYPYDNILNVGLLEWGYRSLWSTDHRLFDWPPGFPLHNSLAGTENLLGWQAFYTPFRLTGMTPVAAYNLIVVGTFVAAGLGTVALARRFGISFPAAIVSGFIFAFVPHRLSSMVQFQNLTVCWVPLILLFADRFLQSSRTRDSVLLGVGGLFVALCSIYAGIFLVFAVATFSALSILAGRHHLRREHLAAAVPTGLGVLLAFTPVLMAYAAFHETHGYDHSREYILQASTKLLDFVQVPSWSWLYSETVLRQRPGYGAAFPGIITMALIGVGTVFGMMRPSRRRAPLLLLGSAAVIAILSLGPVLHIHTYPSRFAPFVPLPGHIFLTVPGVRMPARLLPWALPFIALVAGLGVQEILMRTRRIWVERGLVLLILAGIALEYAPMHSFVGRSVAIPAPLEVSDAYPALRDLEDDVVVVELPNEYSWFGFGTQALYVYGASAHMRRTASYYAGTLPPEPLRLHELAKELPQERARTQLAELGVTHLVLHRHLLGPIEGPELEREMLRACYLSVHRGPQSTILDLRRLEGGCWREEKPWEPNDAAPLE